MNIPLTWQRNCILHGAVIKTNSFNFFPTGQNRVTSSQVSASTSQGRTTSNPAGPATTTTPIQIPLTSTTTSNTAVTPATQALTGSALNDTTTMSNTDGLNSLPSTPASPTPYVTTQTTQSTSISAQTLSSNHISHPVSGFSTAETTANHTPASSPNEPTVMTQVTNQTAVLRTTTSNALFTGTAIITAFWLSFFLLFWKKTDGFYFGDNYRILN